MLKKIDRRSFVRNLSMGAAAATMLENPARLFASGNRKQVRMGIIGVGARGQFHVSELMRRGDVEIIAIADPDPSSIAKALALTREKGIKDPVLFTKGDEDFMNLLKRDDIDAVVIASPWEWHVPQSIEAMKVGKAVGVEVCGGINLQDSWDLVDSFEKTGTPIMILENVCYRRDIMAILNMVQKGRFGEILHLQGGYQHDLRPQSFNTAATCCDGVDFGPGAVGNAKWRTEHFVKRNGDLYPTHGFGPLALMVDINRGNRLTTLSSIACKSRGLNRYIAHQPKGGPDHPNAKRRFALGDIVTTQMQTANGETIVLTHDTTSPRPYNLGFRVQGTNGLWQDQHEGEPEQGRIYFEDKSPEHSWESPVAYLEEYDHPLWKTMGKDAEGSGHGGMDFFSEKAFVEGVRDKKPFPLDVYDLATWYAITPLSENSIAQGGAMVEVPDFTRGKWKERVSFREIL